MRLRDRTRLMLFVLAMVFYVASLMLPPASNALKATGIGAAPLPTALPIVTPTPVALGADVDVDMFFNRFALLDAKGSLSTPPAGPERVPRLDPTAPIGASVTSNCDPQPLTITEDREGFTAEVAVDGSRQWVHAHGTVCGRNVDEIGMSGIVLAGRLIPPSSSLSHVGNETAATSSGAGVVASSAPESPSPSSAPDCGKVSALLHIQLVAATVDGRSVCKIAPSGTPPAASQGGSATTGVSGS